MSGFGQSSATEPAVVGSKVHLALKGSSPKVSEQMVLRQGLAAWGAEVVILPPPPPHPPAVSGKSTPPWCEGVSLLGPTAASPSLAASETARSGRQALEFQVCRGEDLESDSAPAWGSGQQGRPGQTSPLPADTSRLRGEGGRAEGRCSGSRPQYLSAGSQRCRRRRGAGENGVRPTCSWVVEKRRLLPSSKASPPAAVHRKPRAPKPGQGAPGSSRDTLAWGSSADPSDPGHTRRPDCLEGSVGHPSAKLPRLRRTRSLKIQAPVELESTPDAGHTPTFPQTQDTHLHLSKRRTPAYISPNAGHLAANPWQFLRAGH